MHSLQSLAEVLAFNSKKWPRENSDDRGAHGACPLQPHLTLLRPKDLWATCTQCSPPQSRAPSRGNTRHSSDACQPSTSTFIISSQSALFTVEKRPTSCPIRSTSSSLSFHISTGNACNTSAVHATAACAQRTQYELGYAACAEDIQTSHLQ